MKHAAFPFLTLGAGDVDAGDWHVNDSDRSRVLLRDQIEGWDYARSFRVDRTISIDPEATVRSLNLGDCNAEFLLVVSMGTGTGSVPRRMKTIFRSVIRPGIPTVLDLYIDGELLSQRMYLQTVIVLASDCAPVSRLAPRSAGSRLWQDSIDIALEGQAPRFPMEVVSFAERFGDRSERGALWYLQWFPGELHRDFGGSVRLLLNDDRKDFIERFVAADVLTLQTTLADVITQILGSAVRENDIGELLKDCDPASVAGHVSDWMHLAFPGMDIAAVRMMQETRPGAFHSAILAMADPVVLGASE